MKRQALLVLGMHRGGTSALAGVLVRLGVDGPRTLMAPNRANPLGYWESEPVARFNDEVLRAAESSWDSWTPIRREWEGSSVALSLAAELPGLVAREFGSAPRFVLKDPRACRLAAFWVRGLETCGVESLPVLIARKPGAVAASLGVRDGLDRGLSLLLWLRHMIDAERATRQRPRSIVTYESLLQDWQGTVARISTELGIEWPCSPEDAKAGITQFLRPDLRHHTENDGPSDSHSELREWTMRASRAFESLALAASEPDVARAHDVLDQIGAELDHAAAMFGIPDETVKHALRERLVVVDTERQALRKHADALEADREGLRRQVAASEDERETLRRRTTAAEQSAAASMARSADLELELEGARQELGAHDAERTILSDQLRLAGRERDHLAGELAAARHHVSELLASGSWRITAPLRALARLIGWWPGRQTG